MRPIVLLGRCVYCERVVLLARPKVSRSRPWENIVWHQRCASREADYMAAMDADAGSLFGDDDA